MDDDVLELTQMVQDDGSVVPVDDGWNEPEPEPEPEPPPMREEREPVFARPTTPPPRRMDPVEDPIVSEPSEALASAAFAQLAGTIGAQGVSLYPGGPTLESIVKELLRPMLRDWLDDNLPPMVERLVQREIERMVRRAQGG